MCRTRGTGSWRRIPASSPRNCCASSIGDLRTGATGTAGWVLLAGLGVGYVISGDYSGWNFGLAEGGFGGLAVATVVIAAMYGAMVLSMAEMSAALPTAGGGYTFARRALGPWGGFATGTAVLIEYSIAPAAIATFIGAYVESLGLFGVTDGWWVYLAVYAIFVAIHLAGVGEALKVMFAITAIALVGLVIFAVASIGNFSLANLTDIAPDPDAMGAGELLPFGYLGIWSALPFAIWFFLAVEGVPLAAEEARDPARNVPRGITAAMTVLVVTGAMVLILVPGAGGAAARQASGNPLVGALVPGTGPARNSPRSPPRKTTSPDPSARLIHLSLPGDGHRGKGSGTIGPSASVARRQDGSDITMRGPDRARGYGQRNQRRQYARPQGRDHRSLHRYLRRDDRRRPGRVPQEVPQDGG
ncbi:amino acid permease [Nocardia rhamnosiphila]